MADAAVAIDRLEALQIAGDVAAQIAFDHPLVLGDDVEDLVELFLSQILGAHVGVEPSLLDDLVGARGADAVDVTEGERDFLLRGDFYTEETWHVGLGLKTGTKTEKYIEEKVYWAELYIPRKVYQKIRKRTRPPSPA